MFTVSQEQYTALIGILLPFALAFILKEHWSATTKKYLALGAALLMAVAQEAVKGTFNHPVNLATEALVIIGVSQGIYHLLQAQLSGGAQAKSPTSIPVTPGAPAPPNSPGV